VQRREGPAMPMTHSEHRKRMARNMDGAVQVNTAWLDT
jgi:hypothetical protein